MKIKFLHLTPSNFFFRNGSVVADYLIHFEPTKNDTVLPTARRILTEGVNNTRNTSTFRAFRVDIETIFVEGELRIKTRVNHFILMYTSESVQS